MRWQEKNNWLYFWICAENGFLNFFSFGTEAARKHQKMHFYFIDCISQHSHNLIFSFLCVCESSFRPIHHQIFKFSIMNNQHWRFNLSGDCWACVDAMQTRKFKDEIFAEKASGRMKILKNFCRNWKLVWAFRRLFKHGD